MLLSIGDPVPGEYGEQVPGVSLPLNDVTEGLYEPAALGGVPPAVEAWHSAEDTTISLH